MSIYGFGLQPLGLQPAEFPQVKFDTGPHTWRAERHQRKRKTMPDS